MFTGIIQAVGQIRALERRGGDLRLQVASGKLDLGDVRLGDSIATHGVCLTVVELADQGYGADVSLETLQLTTLGKLQPGDAVNLEKALALGARLGGHLVSGHVDGVGELLERAPDGRSQRLRLRAPAQLARYIAFKGSICVDGVSLTVNKVEGAEFELNIIPATLRETTLGQYRVGQAVNLEVDLLARYLERLMLGEAAAEPEAGISRDFLQDHGYLEQER